MSAPASSSYSSSSSSLTEQPRVLSDRMLDAMKWHQDFYATPAMIESGKFEVHRPKWEQRGLQYIYKGLGKKSYNPEAENTEYVKDLKDWEAEVAEAKLDECYDDDEDDYKSNKPCEPLSKAARSFYIGPNSDACDGDGGGSDSEDDDAVLQQQLQLQPSPRSFLVEHIVKFDHTTLANIIAEYDFKKDSDSDDDEEQKEDSTRIKLRAFKLSTEPYLNLVNRVYKLIGQEMDSAEMPIGYHPVAELMCGIVLSINFHWLSPSDMDKMLLAWGHDKISSGSRVQAHTQNPIQQDNEKSTSDVELESDTKLLMAFQVYLFKELVSKRWIGESCRGYNSVLGRFRDNLEFLQMQDDMSDDNDPKVDDVNDRKKQAKVELEIASGTCQECKTSNAFSSSNTYRQHKQSTACFEEIRKLNKDKMARDHVQFRMRGKCELCGVKNITDFKQHDEQDCISLVAQRKRTVEAAELDKDNDETEEGSCVENSVANPAKKARSSSSS